MTEGHPQQSFVTRLRAMADALADHPSSVREVSCRSPYLRRLTCHGSSSQTSSNRFRRVAGRCVRMICRVPGLVRRAASHGSMVNRSQSGQPATGE